MEIENQIIDNSYKISLNNNAVTVYHGLVISTGEEYIKIRDKFNKIVFIPIKNILAMEQEK